MDANLTSIIVDSSTSSDVLHSGKFYTIVFLGFTLSLLTILGNGMVLLSFKLDRELRHTSNYFLISLAWCDMSIGTISIPLMTYYTATGSWGIGYPLCQFWLCMDYLMSNASVMNLLLISFDRFFTVTRPLTYRPWRTAIKAKIAIAGTFIISALLWPPWILIWPSIDGRITPPEGTCYVQFLETSPMITVCTAFAAFYIPVAIMMILYARVYNVAQKRRRIFATMDAHSKMSVGTDRHRKSLPVAVETVQKQTEKKANKERKQKTENKAARTLLAIMLAFIITWLPYDLVVIWEIFHPKTTPAWMWSLAYALCYVNSTLNPICYALGNPQYRATYLKILRGEFSLSQRATMRRRSTVEDRI